MSLISKEAIYTNEQIISWFTNLKTKTILEVEPCNLDEIKNWTITRNKIKHTKNKFFEVLGFNIKIGYREVSGWSQPLVKQVEEGIVGFIVKKINSVYHLLVHAKLEPGNFDILEMAPTVQCITGSYKKAEYPVAFLEYFLEKKGIVYYDLLQSEEGGRFFREQNRYIVMEVGEDFQIGGQEKFIWMTFGQAKEFIKFNNYFNIEARSLIDVQVCRKCYYLRMEKSSTPFSRFDKKYHVQNKN